MKIIFAGKGKALVQIILYTIKNYDFLDLHVLPVDSDDGKGDWQVSVKKLCNLYNLKTILYSEAKEIKNSIFISVQFDKIIRPNEFKNSNIFNIHFSYLPYYKGVYPIIWPIINQEEFSGVTLHYIDPGIDTGNIIDQEKIALNSNLNALDLYLECCRVSLILFTRNFEKLIGSDEIISKKQTLNFGSYYSKKSLNLSDFQIDYRKTASEVSAQFRALMFKPYQMPKIEGYEVNKADILDETDYSTSGKLFFHDDKHFIISTINFLVKVEKDYSNVVFDLIKKSYSKDALKLIEKLNIRNLRNKLGWTPLMVAAYNGNKQLVEELVNLEFNVNDTNYKGTNVIMFAKTQALLTNDFSILDFLIEKGANLNHLDDYGLSLMNYANKDNNQIVIDYLKNKILIFNSNLDN